MLPSSALLRRARGASLTEYGLVVGLIAVLAIGAVFSTGQRVEATFCEATATLEGQINGDLGRDCIDDGALVLRVDTRLDPGAPVTLTFGAGGSGPSPDIRIDWGDDQVDTYDFGGGNISHTYAEDGLYTIRVTGEAGFFKSEADDALVAVPSFGELGLVSLWNGFSGHTNLETLPDTLPDSVRILQHLLEDTSADVNPVEMANWDTSAVTQFSSLAYDAAGFNVDISGWDVSSATQMTNMFRNAAVFSRDLSGWDVSNVTNFNSMFRDAGAFNADLATWEPLSITGASAVSGMFFNAASFTSDLSGWCVSSVTFVPANFSTGTAGVTDPLWGSCP